MSQNHSRAHAFALILPFVCLGMQALAQSEYKSTSWELLKDVQFKEAYDENAATSYDVPVFGESLKKLKGKKIAITGYIIPMDINLNYYVLSAFPFAACFFCGGAGPESVIDLRLTEDARFTTDQRVTFCGTLELNDGSFFELPYALSDAVICEKIKD